MVNGGGWHALSSLAGSSPGRQTLPLTVAAIALGSNLESIWGSRADALREAVKRVGSLGRVVAVSGFHDTEPVGYTDQPKFLNGALLLETKLGAEELMVRLLEIERAMGRDRMRVVAKGPRIIDLDLLLFGNQTISTSELSVPHPALRDRRFVLEPLAEIAGEMVDPVTGLTIRELLAQL